MKTRPLWDQVELPSLSKKERDKNLIAFLQNELMTFRAYPLLSPTSSKLLIFRSMIFEKKLLKLIDDKLKVLNITKSKLIDDFIIKLFRKTILWHINSSLDDEHFILNELIKHFNYKEKIQGKYLTISKRKPYFELNIPEIEGLILELIWMLQVFALLYDVRDDKLIDSLFEQGRNKFNKPLESDDSILSKAKLYYKKNHLEPREPSITGFLRYLGSNKSRASFVEFLEKDKETYNEIRKLFRMKPK